MKQKPYGNFLIKVQDIMKTIQFLRKIHSWLDVSLLIVLHWLYSNQRLILMVHIIFYTPMQNFAVGFEAQNDQVMDQECVGMHNLERGNFYANQAYQIGAYNGQGVRSEGIAMDEEEDSELIYFRLFFSPKETAESIQRRNENLEMLSFENSDEEPDDVYNRRKKRVVDLMSKEEMQLQLIKDIQR